MPFNILPGSVSKTVMLVMPVTLTHPVRRRLQKYDAQERTPPSRTPLTKIVLFADASLAPVFVVFVLMLEHDS